MSQPQPDTAPPSQLPVETLQRWLDSLDKAAGWRDWLLPHITALHSQAEKDILTAHLEGKPVDETAVSNYRVLEPLLKMIKDRRALVIAHLKNPQL